MSDLYILIGRSIDQDYLCIKNTSELDFELRNSGLIAGGYTYFFAPENLAKVVAVARLRGYKVEFDTPFTATLPANLRLPQDDEPHT